METLNKPPENLRKGDALSYDGADWVVTDIDEYKESEDYRELQWIIYSDKRGECYLVRSEEKRDSSVEYTWVFTRPFNINIVQYEISPGAWQHLREDDFVSSPPEKLKFDNVIFHFAGETSGKAEDDDGLTVTKLTWDYYDPTRTRNLAIEVWKEQDRDYPEAYDGIVIKPYNIKVLRPEAARRVKVKSQGWQAELSIYAGIVFVFVVIGVPFDVCIGFSVPILSVYMAVVRSAGSLRLYGASALVWLAIGAFGFFTRMGASYWLVSGSGIILATVIARLAALTASGEAMDDYSLISLIGLLPALWIYSFIMYFAFAPGPHSLAQFLVTCALPLFPSLASYALNRFLEREYGTT